MIQPTSQPLTRTGVAALEFAVVAPAIFVTVLGIIDLGRSYFALQELNHAARVGCRSGIIPGRSSEEISTAVASCLADMGCGNADAAVVTVNGASADASTAESGDFITVSVSIPVRRLSWVSKVVDLGPGSLTGTCSMERE